MIPGPVAVDDDVLAAMAEPTLPHYGAHWMEVFTETVDLLKQLFETQNDVLLMPGPGSGALDTAIGSLLPGGAGIYAPSNGFFAVRLRQIAEAYGLRAWGMELPQGEPIRPETVREDLSTLIPQAHAAGSPIQAIAIVHHETSTGVLNPVGEIAAVAHEFGLPVIVDAVASFGGARLPVDEWGIDVCVSVPNKCLGAPPGVAMLAISPRAWALSGANPTHHGWYHDLRTWDWYIQHWGWHPYPTTLPTNNIVGLHAALKHIFAIGVETHLARIAAAAQQVREGLYRLGFELLPGPAYAAPMLTAARPAGNGVDTEALREYLYEECAVMIGGGLADLKGKIIRVGHMGRAVEQAYIDALLHGVAAYLHLKVAPG
jgi:alanine-glyoxylate transaminase/serine-glyoxylate transaminase/serine-pyruvate transaminase